MAHLGSHWDTLRAHLGALWPHLGAPGGNFGTLLGTQAAILRAPGRPMATFFRFGSDFAENMKIIEKPRFSYGFSMISGVRRASKSMKNLKKSSPECLGTPKNQPGWAGLSGLAAQVANMGQMGGQWTPQWLQQGG